MGQGEVVGAPKGTNSMAVAGLSFRNTLVSCIGRSLLSSIHKWAKKTVLTTCSAPISYSEACSQSGQVVASREL